MKRYRGVDLHRTQFTVCTRLENGRTYLRQWPIRELKLFAVQLRKDDELAVEATSNTRLFYDGVVRKVARVVVVNPSQFKVISESVKKTDRNDAETLALYLSKDLLPEVRMKERSQREMSHLAQTRDLLVKQRTALKTKINNLLSAEGINLKKEALSSNKALERVLALPLSPVLAAEARVLVAQNPQPDRQHRRVGRADRSRGSQAGRTRKPDEHQGHRPGQRCRTAERHRQDRRLRRPRQTGLLKTGLN